MSSANSRRLVTLALSMGVLGGALLVVSNATFASGKLILLPYAFLLFMAAVLTRGEQVASFVARFAVLLATFVLSSGVLYVVIALSPVSSRLSVFEHLWRVAFVVAIGAVLALPLARVTDSARSHRPCSNDAQA